MARAMAYLKASSGGLRSGAAEDGFAQGGAGGAGVPESTWGARAALIWATDQKEGWRQAGPFRSATRGGTGRSWSPSAGPSRPPRPGRPGERLRGRGGQGRPGIRPGPRRAEPGHGQEAGARARRAQPPRSSSPATASGVAAVGGQRSGQGGGALAGQGQARRRPPIKVSLARA